MQYHNITTGKAGFGAMNTGGLFKRHLQEPILDFVIADDINSLEANVERLAGRIIKPKQEIPGVGLVVMVQDTEENLIGLWQTVQKQA